MRIGINLIAMASQYLGNKGFSAFDRPLNLFQCVQSTQQNQYRLFARELGQPIGHIYVAVLIGVNGLDAQAWKFRFERDQIINQFSQSRMIDGIRYFNLRYLCFAMGYSIDNGLLIAVNLESDRQALMSFQRRINQTREKLC